MTDLRSKIQNLKSKIEKGLIVSCQAPSDSPLHKPEIIAAFAEVAAQNGAVGVRIDSPAHISAVKSRVKIPLIGIYKIISTESEVYITPTFASARELAEAGADIIALDATFRPRPNGEKLAEIVQRIRSELNLPVMADISTLEEGKNADKIGCDFIGTTLSGYTKETNGKTETDFELVAESAKNLSVPIICEGRLKTPADVRRALDCGAFAVVVGGSITGIDLLVKKFSEATFRQPIL